MSVQGVDLAITTDSFVVKPIRFPGGSIGELAVNGTVNDLAVAGARPLALSLSLILEEGLDADELRAEVEAIAAAARGGRGRDRGRRHEGRRARPCGPDVHLHDGDRRASTRARASPQPPSNRATRSSCPDPIGEHGTAIMLARGELDLDADDRVGHVLAMAGRRTRCSTRRDVAALHARRDAGRSRLGAERAGARVGGGDDRARGGRAGRPGRRRRGGAARHRPDVRRKRGKARRLRRAGGGGARAGRAAVGAGVRAGRARSAR